MVDAIEDLLPQGNRLQILTPEEYELLWGLPQFTASERELFFTLTPREEVTYGRLRSHRTRLHFLLHLGYFKARQRFFVVDPVAMGDDIEYLADRYGLTGHISDVAVSKHTRLLHISWILELFGYHLIEQKDRFDLERRAAL